MKNGEIRGAANFCIKVDEAATSEILAIIGALRESNEKRDEKKSVNILLLSGSCFVAFGGGLFLYLRN